MTASDETPQCPPFPYGRILSDTVYAATANELPGFGTLLSQGATVGAGLALLIPVRGILSNDKFYALLFLGSLPSYLALGMGIGVVEGIIIWAFTYITGHRLNAVVRAGIGIVILALLMAGSYLLFMHPSPYHDDVSLMDYVFGNGTTILVGGLFGLVSGSRFQPWRELVRGTTPPQFLLVTGITGFALRGVVILFLMQSLLILTWTLQEPFTQKDFGFAAIAVGHFTAAALILFSRLPFWLLLPLTIIVNFPVVALVTDVLKADDTFARTVTLNYLVLWAAFLSSRWKVPQAALSFIKDEFHYYFGGEE